MNGYRKYLIDHPDENMSWCRPYTNGDISVVVCEGKVNGLVIDGHDLPEHPDDCASLVAHLLTGDDYDCYEGYSDVEIVLANLPREVGCCDCPYFDFCAACDNPDGWADAPESADYPDDPDDI